MEHITQSSIYWITRLDHINSALITFLVISSFITVIGVIGFLVNKADLMQYADGNYTNREAKVYAKIFKRIFQVSIPVFVLCLAGVLFVPTTKEVCAIKIIPALVNNQQIQGVGTDVLQLAQDWINELKPKAKQ